MLNLSTDDCKNVIGANYNKSSKDKDLVFEYKCIDFSSLKPNNVSLGGNWISAPKITYGLIMFNMCNSINNPNCKSREEIYKFLDSNELLIAFIFPTFTWSSKDNLHTNPLKKDISAQYIPINSDTINYVSAYIETVVSSDDQNDIYENPQDEAMFYYKDHKNEPIVALKQNRFKGGSYPTNELITNFSFYFTSQIRSYKRKFMKIPAILSLLGGILTTFTSSLGIILYYYNVFLRNLYLMSDSFNFIDDEKNLKFEDVTNDKQLKYKTVELSNLVNDRVDKRNQTFNEYINSSDKNLNIELTTFIKFLFIILNESS